MSRSVDHALGFAVGRIRRALARELSVRLPRQSSFSLTTAIGAAYFAALISAHILIHRHTLVETSAQVAQLALCLLGALWALAAGRRLPRWAGLVLVSGVGAGVTVAQATSPDMGGLLSGLYLLPLLALYLGWAYTARTARIGVGALASAAAVAAVSNPHLVDPAHAVAWSSLYAGLVSVFVLEVSIALIRGLRFAMSSDPLTGALNRRALRAEVRTRRRGGHWVVVIDMDALKPFNDRHGHAAGDALLRDSVRAWRRALEETALIGRWGGDEFVIIVEADDSEAVQRVVARLRAVSPHGFSAGVAQLAPTVSLDRAVKQADRQLYRDKRHATSRASGVYPRRMPLASPADAAPGESRHSLATLVFIGAAALFLLSDLPDLFVAANAAEAVVPVIDVLVGGNVLAIALVLKDRFPSWAALAWVALNAVTTFGHLATMFWTVPLAEALLGLQLIATLLACFYSARVARAFMLLVILAMVAGIAVADPQIVRGIGHVPIAIGIPASWFLLEVVLAVRLRLRRRAEVDELTTALNRLGFEERLARMVRQAHRRGTPLSLVAIDFDDFKLLNDEYGHHRGDLALRTAVAQWRERLRSGDAIGRFGGDEFVVALPGVGLEQAGGVMRRLRAQAEDSWSWGAVGLRVGERPADLLLRADRALYAAKNRRPRRARSPRYAAMPATESVAVVPEARVTRAR
jgi:diguanylate cyclase (GGDEF)-like protein